MARSRSVLPIIALVALLAIGGSASAGTDEGGGNEDRDPNSPIDLPTEDEAADFAATVCQCATELENAGSEAAAVPLLMCVLDRWWPTAIFPPIADDPPSILEAWEMTKLAVATYRDDPQLYRETFCGDDGGGGGGGGGFGITDNAGGDGDGDGDGFGLDGTDTAGPGPVEFVFGNEATPGYPWEAPHIHRGSNGAHVPTPGMFFLVRDPDAPTDSEFALNTMLGIARYALGSAYAMAGAPRSIFSIPAEEVIDYLALIVCSPWNDTAYGTTNSLIATGGVLGLGPHGRGVNMTKRHRDNIAALVQGISPERTTLINGNTDSLVEGDSSSFPQIWLPPIRLDLLRDFGTVTTQGMEWSNGDSVMVPPPTVWQHGVRSRVGPPGGTFWGC